MAGATRRKRKTTTAIQPRQTAAETALVTPRISEPKTS
jgi:hypothetical protein